LTGTWTVTLHTSKWHQLWYLNGWEECQKATFSESLLAEFVGCNDDNDDDEKTLNRHLLSPAPLKGDGRGIVLRGFLSVMTSALIYAKIPRCPSLKADFDMSWMKMGYVTQSMLLNEEDTCRIYRC
jgi:hypothetical protein